MRGIKLGKKPAGEGTAEAGSKKDLRQMLAFKKKDGAVSSGRSVPLGGERMVLMVGDEGSVLVHLKRGKVAARAYSPASGAPETEGMTEIVRKSPKAGLYVIFDTVDQIYTQQTLPPVTALSINKLIQRRLERDFSSEYIKGAIKLGRDKSGRKDWQFMMAAVQRTSAVNGWIEVIKEWPNTCRGMSLLPAESTEIVKRLHALIRKESKEDEPANPEWQILASYNKVSGVRQMVFHEGKLMLTRLGQPAVDSTSETIAGTIEQELIATREYLQRTSVQDVEIQSIIIIASQEIRSSIDPARLGGKFVHLVTPFEAANMLSLQGAAAQTDRFGDSLLCAAYGTNKKRTLSLTIPDLGKVQSLQTAMYAIRGLAALAVVGMVLSMLMTLWDVYTLGDEVADLEKQKLGRQADLDALKSHSKYTPEQLDRINGSVDLYQRMEKDAILPEYSLMRISDAMGTKKITEDVIWDLKAKKSGGAAAPNPHAGGGHPDVSSGAPAVPYEGPDVEVSLTVSFSPEMMSDRKLLQQETTDILNQLKAKLPEYTVKYTELPSLVTDSERIEVELSKAGEAAAKKPGPKAPEKNTAKLQINGPAGAGEKNAAAQN